MIHFFLSIQNNLHIYVEIFFALYWKVMKVIQSVCLLRYSSAKWIYKESRIGLVTLCQHPLLLLLHDQTCLISFSRSEMLWGNFLLILTVATTSFYSAMQPKFASLWLYSPPNKAAARLLHGYLISGPSDTGHLLHPTSRLVCGALRRASAGIGLTRASGDSGGMSGG